MIHKREILIFMLAGAIIGCLEAWIGFTWSSWLWMSVFGAIIVFVHALGQKLAAAAYDASTETSIWKVERFGWYERSYWRRPFPAGIFAPIIVIFATFGYIKLLAVTTFEVAAWPSRKREFSKLTEMELGIISLAGSIANAVLAFLMFLFGYNEFAMMNLWFIFFNLVPISNLDGVKIFFASRLLWVFSFFFILSLIILFEVTGLWAALISAFVIALVILVAYYLSFEN